MAIHTDKQVREKIRAAKSVYFDILHGPDGPYVQSYTMLGDGRRNEAETEKLRSAMQQAVDTYAQVLLQVFDD